MLYNMYYIIILPWITILILNSEDLLICKDIYKKCQVIFLLAINQSKYEFHKGFGEFLTMGQKLGIRIK